MTGNYKFIPKGYDKKDRLMWEFANGNNLVALGRYDFHKDELFIEFDVMTDEDREALNEELKDNDFI